MILYRVQDKRGRGPFAPGFSSKWRDAHGPALPPFFMELGLNPDEARKLIPANRFGGCACRSLAELRRWFSRAELRRLARHGYSIVEFEPDMIVAETETQVVFANRDPLSYLNTERAA